LDLAEKELAKIQNNPNSSLLGQLIEAWFGIHTSNPSKLEDSFYFLDEILASNHPTSKLLGAKGICLLQVGKWQEAEQVLLEAVNQNPQDSNCIANLIVCAHHLKQPQTVIDEYVRYTMAH
jgi:coatomer protein complex subunit epsilon